MHSSGPSPRKILRLEDEFTSIAGRETISELQKSQMELEELNDKASKEILSIESKYNQLRKPYYDKRDKVIEKIPQFWLRVLENHPQTSSLVADGEEDCLFFLRKLNVKEREDIEEGFQIKFIFDENPFFENTELVKDFQLGPTINEPKSTSTEIKWKKDRNLLKVALDNRQNSREQGSGLEPVSFFLWFWDNTKPLENEIAELIKDDLWPNPLQYVLGEDDDGQDEMEEEEEEEETGITSDEGDDDTKDDV